MKRTKKSQAALDELRKRPKVAPASNQSSMESPVSNGPDQPTDSGSSDTGQEVPPAGPKIVLHKAEGTGRSSEPTEQTPERGTTYKELVIVQPSPSSSQDISKALSAPPTPQSAVEESPILESITYNLQFIFDFDGCQDSELDEDHSVLLNKLEGYQEIERVADTHARDLSAKVIGQKELKFFYGSCTLVSDQGTRNGLPLRSPKDWTKVKERIVKYQNLHTREKLHLRISRHYLASQEQPIGGKFADAKSLEIDDLMKQTWDRKGYIAHNVLEQVVSNEVISWIIKEDPPQSVAQEQQDSFIHRVQAEGRILLAMCVHKSLRMECLKKLLDSGWTDSWVDSGMLLDESFQCHDVCRQKFKALLKAQGSFGAARFAEGKHQEFDLDTVVPLHYCRRAPGKNDTDLKAGALCGRGVSSEVYCVTLNPNHHSLSEDLDARFALKIMHPIERSSRYFAREQTISRALRELAHPHIVTHLATWTQDGKHYIIMPYAQCDLRQYMEHNTFLQEDASWLLDQFRGMADAIRQIHNPSDKEEPTPNLTVIRERTTAWHHDIKPDNILFFEDSCSKYGRFGLTDWGAAKVNPYRTRSYNTRSPLGTYTYEPPDFDSKGTTSRPHDIWSLGCVFLELLVWAVFSWRHVTTFSDERDGELDANSSNNNTAVDAFWEKNGSDYRLRPSVVTQLQKLDEELGKPGALPFKEVMGYIRRMLEIEAKKRIKAQELCLLLSEPILMKTRGMENISDQVKFATLSSILTAQQYPDSMAHESSPTGRSSYPAYAELFNLSPSDMSSRAGRHSRNNSAATHSRQSSNASNHSTLSFRDPKGSHSSANPSKATEGGT